MTKEWQKKSKRMAKEGQKNKYITAYNKSWASKRPS
jgi:hypothetical protein